MWRLIGLAFIAAGCAQQGFPPGGPEIKVPPKLLSVAPESGAVNVHPKEVVLTFDAVLNEKPAGSASDLSQLVLISPRLGEPRVGWHRKTLTIRGHKNWQPNTAYTVTLLPGVADLRGNVRKQATTLVFSTGPTIPDTRIRGMVFDWTSGRPLAAAIVEAVAHPDTNIVYVAATDSIGAFTIGHLPPGTYTVRGYDDANHNRALDPREPWDSAHVSLTDSARVELLTFIHDTIGPILQQVSLLDSVTIRATFDRPLDPAQPLDTTLFTLRRSDSTIVPLRSVEPGPLWDSTRAATTPAETAKVVHPPGRAAAAPPLRGRAARDTTQHAPLPKPSRPSPVSDVVLTLGATLAPGTSYRLEARQVKNLLGYPASTSRIFAVPKAPPPKSAPSDTTKRPKPKPLR